MAQILIGPDGLVQLTTGIHDVYGKVEDNPERPVFWCRRVAME